jgi:hypothetical protein
MNPSQLRHLDRKHPERFLIPKPPGVSFENAGSLRPKKKNLLLFRSEESESRERNKLIVERKKVEAKNQDREEIGKLSGRDCEEAVKKS